MKSLQVQVRLQQIECLIRQGVVALINAIVVVREHIFIGLYSSTAQIEKREIGSLRFIASYNLHENSVHTLIYHNGLIFSGSEDELIVCFDPETGKVVRRFSG